jgi:hypothetical protein
MQITKTSKIVASVFLIVILSGIYFFLDGDSKNTEDKSANNEEVATTTSEVSKTDGPTYTIEAIPSKKTVNIPVPDLNRPITKFPTANVSEADFLNATKKVKEYQELLKNDPKLISVWLDMAMYQKEGGDYIGASISWKYVSDITAPNNFVSLGNLGDLYAYYIKDNAMSEMYYKKAIESAPNQVYLYSQLFDVYKDVFKDLNKARAIIDEGLKNIPNDPYLLQVKNSLQ